MVSSYGISKGYVGLTVGSRIASKARRVRDDLKSAHEPYSCKNLQALTCRASTGQRSETKASSYNSTHKVLCRRDALTAVVMAFTSASGVQSATAGASISEMVPPQVGDCPDCIGVLNGLLNSCPPETVSCASSQNDDEAHFIKPWICEGSRSEAMDKLIYIATGGYYDPGLIQSPYGVSRSQAAGFILKTTGAFLVGNPLPKRPSRAKANPSEIRRFDGKVETRDDGEGYVRFIFGPEGGVQYDAEFLFVPDDELVDIRIGARGDRTQEKFGLSLEDGFRIDRNGSRALCDNLRKALQWQEAIVITNFDPMFNNDKKFWFEKSFEALNMAPADINTSLLVPQP